MGSFGHRSVTATVAFWIAHLISSAISLEPSNLDCFRALYL